MEGITGMNCEQARNLFDAHLDGELSATLETELGAHRLQCAECRHQLAVMEVVGHVVAADGKHDPLLDDRFTDRLLACLDQSRPGFTHRWIRRWRIGGSFLAAAAAIALVVTLAPWFNRPQPRVLGDRHENETAPKLDVAADSLVHHVETTWTQRAHNAQELVEFGKMTITQVLDRLGIDEAIEQAEPFELIPESFDELAPDVAGDHGIEDL